MDFNHTLIEKLRNSAPPEGFISGSGATTWSAECSYLLLKGWNTSRDDVIRDGLVDRNGMITNMVEDAWGVTVQVCEKFCSRSSLSLIFNFNRFASGSTNYLLPWLALAAQLPYETGSALGNIFSFCIALGSPVLITYSLMMTILNARWADKLFKNLRTMAGECHRFQGPVNNAQILVLAARQTPIRLSHQNGYLWNLVSLRDNERWWELIGKRLEASLRGFTLSFFAQTMVAIIAWLLTVVGSVDSKLGNTSEALVLSSGTMWTWLIPVIWGWIMVDSQGASNTIQDALDGACAAASTDNQPVQPRQGQQTAEASANDSSESEHRDQQQQQHQQNLKSSRKYGIIVFENGNNKMLGPESVSATPIRRQATRATTPGDHDEIKPALRLFGVGDDERQQGPAFNFARVITWRNFTKHLCDTFERAMEAEQSMSDTDPTRREISPPPAPRLFEYDMEPTKDHDFWWHVICATGAGLLLQWGTTGTAIFIAIKTPVEGLGCRSGSYLLYGVVATAAFIIMQISAFAAHMAMNLQEKQYKVSAPDDPRETSSDGILLGDVPPEHGPSSTAPSERPMEQPPQDPGTQRSNGSGNQRQEPEPTISQVKLQFYRHVAALCRVFGYFLLMANTSWLLLISLFELIGFFDSCYCSANQLSTGAKGWALLFADDLSLQIKAQSSWIGGISMTVIICGFSVGLFWCCSRDSRSN